MLLCMARRRSNFFKGIIAFMSQSHAERVPRIGRTNNACLLRLRPQTGSQGISDLTKTSLGKMHLSHRLGLTSAMFLDAEGSL